MFTLLRYSNFSVWALFSIEMTKNEACQPVCIGRNPICWHKTIRCCFICLHFLHSEASFRSLFQSLFRRLYAIAYEGVYNIHNLTLDNGWIWILSCLFKISPQNQRNWKNIIHNSPSSRINILVGQQISRKKGTSEVSYIFLYYRTIALSSLYILKSNKSLGWR